MKKQIIKINGRYYPRYKKWYHLRWRYVGNYSWWLNYYHSWLGEYDIDIARYKLHIFFNREIIVIE